MSAIRYYSPYKWRGVELGAWEEPYWHIPHPDREDDNDAVIKKAKRQHRKLKIQHVVKNCMKLRNPVSALPAQPTTPAPRTFNWMITSTHVPLEYRTHTLHTHAPWVLVLRFFLMDLPKQLCGKTCLNNWTDYLINGSEDVECIVPSILSPQPYPYRKRVVFSGTDGKGWLTGQWLVTAYVMSDNLEWLERANVKNLVSYESLFRMKAFENVPCHGTKTGLTWHQFYRLDQGQYPTPSRVFAGPVRPYCDPPIVPQGQPVPERISSLRTLMDDQAKKLFYARHEDSVSARTAPRDGTRNLERRVHRMQVTEP